MRAAVSTPVLFTATPPTRRGVSGFQLCTTNCYYWITLCSSELLRSTSTVHGSEHLPWSESDPSLRLDCARSPLQLDNAKAQGNGAGRGMALASRVTGTDHLEILSAGCSCSGGRGRADRIASGKKKARGREKEPASDAATARRDGKARGQNICLAWTENLPSQILFLNHDPCHLFSLSLSHLYAAHRCAGSIPAEEREPTCQHGRQQLSFRFINKDTLTMHQTISQSYVSIARFPQRWHRRLVCSVTSLSSIYSR